MSTISHVVRFRRRRHARAHKVLAWAGLATGVFICLLAALTVLFGAWTYSNLTRELPSAEMLPVLLEPPNGALLQPSRLYDRSQEHILVTLENPGVHGKQYLEVGADGGKGMKQFSPYLVSTTVSVFDPGFWEHAGYSIAGWSTGSHTTLAQWLVSELVLDEEPASIKRNLRERLLAAQITTKYGREKILEWYLNSAPYGEMIYGADAAAHVYLGKSASSLTLAEAAMLTAISETPSITPSSVSQFLKQQQRHVIQTMLTAGKITQEQADSAILEDVKLKDQLPFTSETPEFTGLVLQQLNQVVPFERIKRGGYDIITTLDFSLQAQVECATRTQSGILQGTIESPSENHQPGCEAALLLPSNPTPGNSEHKSINAEAIIVDPQTAQILSMVGYGSHGIAPGVLPAHSAGTILSPFLYITAFARGLSPGSLLWDVPNDTGVSSNLQSTAWGQTPQGFHGPVRLRMALANDYLAAAEDVLEQVRVENVWLTEEHFGIPVSKTETPVTSVENLFSQRNSLLDILSAYDVLANQGMAVGQPGLQPDLDANKDSLIPTGILKVIGPSGDLIIDWSTPQTRPIISPQLAYLATHILSDEKARRPSLGHPNPLEIGRPVSAKVGTTQDGTQAWTVGYTPELAVGVWVGNRTGDVSEMPVEIPAALWHAVMQYTSSLEPSQGFKKPEGVSLVQVCDPSGLLVSKLCPSIAEEVFLDANVPTQVDNLFQQFSINKATGLLATIFTPQNMLEQKVYLVVPPESVEWAKEAGLTIPPDSYDTIYSVQSVNKNAEITFPGQFDQVNGSVQINGSAEGVDFAYYRLQVGQGLNPQEWLQVGEDKSEPVHDGVLGIWNTQGLEGLYVIQMQVVRQDQRVDRAIVQVTVDNTPPQVEILAPNDGENYTYLSDKPIMIQVSAKDNLQVQKVEYFVDGRFERSLLQPPYIILWEPKLGDHSLQVKVYDLAGNLSQSSIKFSVIK